MKRLVSVIGNYQNIPENDGIFGKETSMFQLHTNKNKSNMHQFQQKFLFIIKMSAQFLKFHIIFDNEAHGSINF